MLLFLAELFVSDRKVGHCLVLFPLFLLNQTPFTLTLRLWDIYILEGEKILTAMAYTTLKLHKSKTRYISLQ